MSQSKPPSPVHPRDFDTSMRGMAETQHPPHFPVPSFLGHPERHHGPLSYGNQPIIHGPHGAAQPRSGHPHEYTILPPLRMHLGTPSTMQSHTPQAVPISKLLSDTPQGPPRMGPPLAPYSPPEARSPPPIMAGRSFYHAGPPFDARATNAYDPHSPGFKHGMASSSSGKAVCSPQCASRSPSSGSVGSVYSPGQPRSAASEKHERMTPNSSPSPNISYTLAMRQQPIAARACGFGERDRRVVDPPPIVEVTLSDKDTGIDEDEAPHVYTTLHCTVVHADTLADASQIEQSRSDMAMTQRLMGTCVASPFPGKDESGRKGTFFVFPDLSCRSPGKYRFLFRLIVVDPIHMASGGTTKIQTQIYSDPFEVYSAKEFPGMRASSALLKTLRKQGLNVAVKKGREATKKSSRRGQADDEDSEDDEEMGEEEDDDDDQQDKKRRKKSA